ncbi:MAG: YggU family protein [Candidatus Hydrogenedentes bacterium]|nr:YggU family protein [Candidatus Hydrogenedentota bacterium]
MDSAALEARAGGVLLRVKVQPKASRSAVLGEQGGRIRIALTAPPVDGAANDALLKFLSTILTVRRNQIEFKSGEQSRDKSLLVHGVTLDEVRAALAGVTA